LHRTLGTTNPPSLDVVRVKTFASCFNLHKYGNNGPPAAPIVQLDHEKRSSLLQEMSSNSILLDIRKRLMVSDHACSYELHTTTTQLDNVEAQLLQQTQKVNLISSDFGRLSRASGTYGILIPLHEQEARSRNNGLMTLMGLNGTVSQPVYQPCRSIDPSVIEHSRQHQRRTKSIIQSYAERCAAVQGIDSRIYTGHHL